MTESVKTTKPYLLRALYEWCVDSGFTPYISVIVDATTRVPHEYVRNGEIVLNIGPLAANRLKMGNEALEFSARFGGLSKELWIPVGRIAAIYARENGQGMSFEIARTDTPWEASGAALAAAEAAPPAAAAETLPAAAGKPVLRVVK